MNLQEDVRPPENAPQFQREVSNLTVNTKHHWYASKQFLEQAGTFLKFNGNWIN